MLVEMVNLPRLLNRINLEVQDYPIMYDNSNEEKENRHKWRDGWNQPRLYNCSNKVGRELVELYNQTEEGSI